MGLPDSTPTIAYLNNAFAEDGQEVSGWYVRKLGIEKCEE